MAFPVSLISEVRIYEPAEIDDMISEAVQVPDLVQSRTKYNTITFLPLSI